MKHIASLLLAILISISLLAYGDNAAGTSVEEIPEVQELAQDEVEEVPTYADVEGYPKELNGYKQCSMCLGRGSTFCAACGGTGRTMRMVNVMDPVTHNFTMRSESSICLSCGGSGSIRCSACGGTGGHY